MKTRGGVKLTKKQEQNVKDLNELMKRWDKHLELNSMAGTLYVMLDSYSKNNQPRMKKLGGLNHLNVVDDFNGNGVSSDGGDW